MTVVIGVDPHKRSHTAVVIDHDEIPLATLQVRAGRSQLSERLAWSSSFDDRVWAIESANGLGYLLGQQLVGAWLARAAFAPTRWHQSQFAR